MGVEEKLTKLYVRGECGDDGWVPCGGVASFSCWISDSWSHHC